LRLVVWNCRMALKRKAAALLSLEPDVAVVPECADLATPDLAALLPGMAGNAWVGPNKHKGLGAMAFGDYSLTPLKRKQDALPDVVVSRVDGPTPFTLAAVWARAPTYVERLHDMLDACGPSLREGHVVLAGDFNSNTIWDKSHGNKSHSALVRRLESDFSLFSAYHGLRGQAHGEETDKTFHMNGRSKFAYHIDYVFLPKAWRGRLQRCEVGAPATWLQHSDHCPVTVDLTDGAA